MLEWRFPDKPQIATTDFLSFVKPSEWYCQHKLDGWRNCVYSDADRNSHLFTRHGNPIQNTTKVPLALIDSISSLCSNLPPLSVIDSEFVGPRGHHNPAIYIFDIMAWDGKWINSMPFEKRWELAKCDIGRFIAPNSSIYLAETVTDNFVEYFNRLKQMWYNNGCGMDLCEGVVLKRKTGTLTLSLRASVKSRHLMKIKYRENKLEK
jgi:ATP-dependent DNA ligase